MTLNAVRLEHLSRNITDAPRVGKVVTFRFKIVDLTT